MKLKDDISGEKKKRKINSASKTKCKNKKPKKGQTKKEDLSFRDFEQMMRKGRTYSRSKGGAIRQKRY
ncbi:hypothetical protein PP175_05520 [Aneurinibacillus sp. Ricciae_BoGa-3]|uniref:hypothetical protein n=1 Tax=Aneurinibacillus sp. Ricciae_BoGa-3 TaxID=3022697 RepID=UPI0023410F72|nr:hypothetical protein [Aneurinibacillus sp. Ricciae_BoGa-3]WCK55410.1 hypothetical protein PP175_05520 [Aneurinibacillus sp. Ricciae_BoGa-3]